VTVPEIGDFSARQLENAKIILAAALPFGTEAAVASLMAAAAESSFLRYANNGRTTRPDVEQKWRDLAALSLQFEHDAVAGEADTTADSIGCFQQRLKYGYSTPDRNGVAELMDPAAATRIFVRGSFGGTGKTRFFLEAPTDRSLAARVQWTQGSEFRSGENYAPFQHVAEQIVATQHALTPSPSGSNRQPSPM